MEERKILQNKRNIENNLIMLFQGCCQSDSFIRILSSLCKEDGYFLPYKSGDIKEEAANSKKAVKILGGSIEDIISFEIPDTDMARTILKIHKTKATPKLFREKQDCRQKNRFARSLYFHFFSLSFR